MKTYQPIFPNEYWIKCLQTQSYMELMEQLALVQDPYERVCLDRLLLIINDMNTLSLVRTSVLDIGCNIGVFSQGLSALGHQVVGVDNNAAPQVQGYYPEPCLDTGNRLNAVYSVNPDFVDADIEDYIRGNTRKFDVVLLLNVVHHFYDGYAKTGNGRKSEGTIEELLDLFCSRAQKAIYFEGPENEGVEYYPNGIKFPEWFIQHNKVQEIIRLGWTVGANGRLRQLYRLQIERKETDYV